MNEVYVVRQEGLDLWIHFTNHVFRAAHGGIDTGYDAFQEVHCTLFRSNHSLPVPLVYIKRMNVAQLFIGTYGIHIGINSVAGFNLIVGQSDTFPFGQ